ncbi:hypothetical protein T484DRAFT_2026981, partial [Baffinella frigidus]
MADKSQRLESGRPGDASWAELRPSRSIQALHVPHALPTSSASPSSSSLPGAMSSLERKCPACAEKARNPLATKVHSAHRLDCPKRQRAPPTPAGECGKCKADDHANQCKTDNLPPPQEYKKGHADSCPKSKVFQASVILHLRSLLRANTTPQRRF